MKRKKKIKVVKQRDILGREIKEDDVFVYSEDNEYRFGVVTLTINGELYWSKLISFEYCEDDGADYFRIFDNYKNLVIKRGDLEKLDAEFLRPIILKTINKSDKLKKVSL